MAALVVAGGITTWHEHQVGLEAVAISDAKRTATSAVSDRSVATRTRPTMDDFSSSHAEEHPDARIRRCRISGP